MKKYKGVFIPEQKELIDSDCDPSCEDLVDCHGINCEDCIYSNDNLNTLVRYLNNEK